ncbi:hypothetical protein MXAN_4834 [Myxococcus xanthus DK 1622]|uniref:Uncharacterized protein n=1 Tax=Myxococcus xanthus (strain DK1622) TaxID=246197 RepID=Q1D2X8_MYXXD|nr:hypothetical protein MXAN_4834 [Myxococcus xanthus DK 1622]
MVTQRAGAHGLGNERRANPHVRGSWPWGLHPSIRDYRPRISWAWAKAAICWALKRPSAMSPTVFAPVRTVSTMSASLPTVPALPNIEATPPSGPPATMASPLSMNLSTNGLASWPMPKGILSSRPPIMLLRGPVMALIALSTRPDTWLSALPILPAMPPMLFARPPTALPMPPSALPIPPSAPAIPPAALPAALAAPAAALRPALLAPFEPRLPFEPPAPPTDMGETSMKGGECTDCRGAWEKVASNPPKRDQARPWGRAGGASGWSPRPPSRAPGPHPPGVTACSRRPASLRSRCNRTWAGQCPARHWRRR